ncbi:MAG: TonB-dependent receptor plug domain-containing protein [Opitutus sp.]
MKTHRHLPAFALVAVLSTPLLAQTSAPGASSTADSVVELPAFTVSASGANPYRATDSLSAARIRGALIDTPATINVITSDFLKDVGANAVFDASQYLAGIGNGRLAGANGILDRVTIRGFENDGRTIDNFETKVQANFGPAMIERVEIVKGPNAILAPTGTPGGVVNVLTKSPESTASHLIGAEVGRFFSQRVWVDSTGPVSMAKGFSYRVIGSFQDTDTFQPGDLHQWAINPSLTYQISDQSKVTLKYAHIDWRANGAAANPGNTWIAGPDVANGAYLPSKPPAGFKYRDAAGIPDWSLRYDGFDRVTLELTSALRQNINMRFAAAYFYDRFESKVATLSFPNINNNHYNPTTGIYTPNLIWSKDASGNYISTTQLQYDPSNVARSASDQKSFEENFQLQNDFAGNFNAGPVSLQPVLGWSLFIDPRYSATWTGAVPNVNLYSQDTSTVAEPTWNQSPSTYAFLRKEQIYAYLRAGFFHDRLFLSSGAARIWLASISKNLSTGVRSELTGFHDTYLEGALFKVTSNASIYYSYSSNANAVLFNNVPLWQTGYQHEYGVKTEFFDQRLSISASHFQIAQTNLVTPNPVYLSIPGAPQFFLSNQTNHGVEVEVVGGITKDLTVIASYTAMKLRDPFARRVRNIPDHTANALLNYRFHDGAFKGGSAFIGVTHVGDQAGETAPNLVLATGVVAQVSFYVPPRTIVNLGASYTWGRYAFNLNIDNALDKHIVWQSSGRNSMSAYPTTNVRFTTTLKF